VSALDSRSTKQMHRIVIYRMPAHHTLATNSQSESKRSTTLEMSPAEKTISCADAGMSCKSTELDCIPLKSMKLCGRSQETITAAVKKCTLAKNDIRVCSRQAELVLLCLTRGMLNTSVAYNCIHC